MAEKKKTANKMKPFTHESEMYEILHDDPSFNPLVRKSFLGTEEFNHHDDISSSSSSSSSSQNASTETEKGQEKEMAGN